MPENEELSSESNYFGFKVKEEFIGILPDSESTDEVVVDEINQTVEDTVEEKKETTEEVVEDKAAELTTETEEETAEIKEEVVSKEETTERSLNNEDEVTEEVEEEDYNTLSSQSVIESLNEQIAEKFGEDITLSDIVEYQSYDFDAMSELDVLEHHLNLITPGISDIEVKAKLRGFNLLNKSDSEIEQMIEDEEITRDDYEDLQAKLMTDVRTATAALKEYQSSINIDDLEIHSPNQQKAIPTKTEEEIRIESERYESMINNLADLKIEVGTKEDPYNLDLKISDEDRNGIRDILSPGENGQNWIEKRWVGQDGLVDMNKLSADMYKLANHDRNMAIAFTQGKSAGVSKEVRNISNIDLESGKSTSNTSTDERSEAAKMAREIN